jgi:hypothetical protein
MRLTRKVREVLTKLERLGGKKGGPKRRESRGCPHDLART